MLWHIELKFYIWLCLTVLQIKFECRQLASIFVGVMPLSGLTGNTQLYTCIDKFSWNLKFHIGFFNAFLLCFRKVLYKNSPLKCSRRAYYAPFAVLRYIFFWKWGIVSDRCMCHVYMYVSFELPKAKEKYRGMFTTQKSGNKTSSGEIGLDIRTHESPNVGQDQVSGGVSILCWPAAPVANVLWTSRSCSVWH